MIPEGCHHKPIKKLTDNLGNNRVSSNQCEILFIKTYPINSVLTELCFNRQVRHFSWAVRWAVVSWEKGGRHSTQINAIQQNNTAQRRFLWQVIMRKDMIMIFLWLYFEASSSTYIFQRPIKKQDKLIIQSYKHTYYL